MAVTALTGVSDVPVGGLWLIAVLVHDVDGLLVAGAPDVTVVPPSGTPAAPVALEQVTTGYYRTSVEVDAAGPWTATVDAAGYGVATLRIHAADVTAPAGFPTVAILVGDRLEDTGYLGPVSYSDAEVQSALDAEAGAQRDVCRVPAALPPALYEALCRRVARNLAMRRLPLAIPQGDAEGGPDVLPGMDPEVRRLERPWRRLTFG